MILQDVVQPTEDVKVTVNNVQAFYKHDSLGNGTLFVTGRAVTWITNGSKGFSVSYPAIVLHAISTDVTSFPYEHVFVMVDKRKSERRRRRAPVLRTIQEDEEHQGLELSAAELEDEESDDDDEEGPGLEIRLVPDDKEALSTIYHEISVGQEENPEEDDPMFDDEEEEEEMEEELGGGDGISSGQWYTAENMGDMELSEEGMANLQRMFNNQRGDHHDEQME